MFTLTVLTVSGSREHVTGWAVRWTGGSLVDMADFPPLLAAGARIACYLPTCLGTSRYLGRLPT